MILRAEHVHFIPGDHGFQPAELQVILYWKDQQTGLPKFDGTNMPTGLSKRVKAEAHISQGRWCADCPTPGCHAASYVSPADKRMWCIKCENIAAAGEWVPVKFPRNRERIEELLLRRALPENRNWYPYESVKDLEAENERHGVNAE